MPEAARQRTVDGAQAFARYFVAIVGHAFESGQTEHFEALSRNCATCERQIATIIQNSAEGIRSTNAEVLAFSIEPFEMYGTRALLEVTASFGPEGYVDVNGNPIPDRGSQGAEGLRATVILTWVAELQSWIVDGDAGFRRP